MVDLLIDLHLAKEENYYIKKDFKLDKKQYKIMIKSNCCIAVIYHEQYCKK